eukprot:gene5953-3034_t
MELLFVDIDVNPGLWQRWRPLRVVKGALERYRASAAVITVLRIIFRQADFLDVAKGGVTSFAVMMM